MRRIAKKEKKNPIAGRSTGNKTSMPSMGKIATSSKSMGKPKATGQTSNKKKNSMKEKSKKLRRSY